MRIIIDADAAPSAIKEILFRASERLNAELILVANTPIRHPSSEIISMITVPNGPDEADDYIAEHAIEDDLVITADIPLAHRVIMKGSAVITPRGDILNRENIGERLAVRDMMDQLRSGGVETGGPPPFSNKDKAAFARSFEHAIARMKKR
ncbi:MAG TPA: YaiI/YqxD family protein [Spirochaetota bacterium]|nr:YaiI/YqxD family protein [Spirochaetota bacterium]